MKWLYRTYTKNRQTLPIYYCVQSHIIYIWWVPDMCTVYIYRHCHDKFWLVCDDNNSIYKLTSHRTLRATRVSFKYLPELSCTPSSVHSLHMQPLPRFHMTSSGLVRVGIYTLMNIIMYYTYIIYLPICIIRTKNT